MVNFIRDTNVDLRNYLPPYLFKDPEFTAKLAAESAEHDNMRKILMDICNQLFVSTATWGLDRWEKFLDIPTDYTQTYESRRQKILRKLQGSQTVTLEFLMKLVNLYVADGQAVVIDHPDTYRIEILYHGGQVLDYEGLQKAIRIYIPAHIGYKLVTITNGCLGVHGAGTVQCAIENIVDMATTYALTIDDSRLKQAGAVIHNYKYSSVSGGGSKQWLNFHL